MSNGTTKHLFWGLALAGLAMMAAPSGCGGSNTGYGAFANADGGGGLGGFDATNGNGSSGNSSNGGGSNGGSSSGDDGSGMCVSMCNQDSDCQGSCPAAPNGGTNCCDLTSHT